MDNLDIFAFLNTFTCGHFLDVEILSSCWKLKKYPKESRKCQNLRREKVPIDEISEFEKRIMQHQFLDLFCFDTFRCNSAMFSLCQSDPCWVNPRPASGHFYSLGFEEVLT